MAQPTVREVAERAGVSPMTVSRTLSGNQRVRSELQQRVLAAAEELGYRRNEVARSLRPGHRSGLIGMVITNLGNPYYGTVALGAEEVARDFGRRIIIGSSGEDVERERRLVRDFVGRQVEGLVVVPASQQAAHLEPQQIHDIPLVLASRTVHGVRADSVMLDDVGGAQRGVASLVQAGHRRIAFLGNATSVETVNRRYAGYAAALTDAGLRLEPSLVVTGQQDPGSAQRAMSALLDSGRPDAVFATNNRNAIGALQEIGRRLEGGWHETLPALLSFDDFELAAMMPVPVTVIDHDPRELGRAAARALLSRVAAEEPFAAPDVLVEMPTTVRVARDQGLR